MKILIAGQAKTGTTGLLYLVSNSLNSKFKILFEPEVCTDDVKQNNENVIAKILISPKFVVDSFLDFEKKITIVRDPRDRIVSSLLYSQFHSSYINDVLAIQDICDCLEKKESAPSQVSIKQILLTIGKWTGNKNENGYRIKSLEKVLKLFDDYIKLTPDALLYKYEDFVTGKYSKLEEHLGFLMTGKAEVPDSLQRVNRTKGYGDWRNWFTKEDVDIYKPVLSPWLAKYGYDPDDWELNENPLIERDHCSGYYMRLLNEKNVKATKGGKINAGKRMSAAKYVLTGTLNKVESRLVSGWAIGISTDEPVQIILLHKGEEIAKTIANKPRPALKEKGIHPTGLCGFVFKFKSDSCLRVGDEVEVVPLNQAFTIKNSPCVVGPSPK